MGDKGLEEYNVRLAIKDYIIKTINEYIEEYFSAYKESFREAK